MNHDPMSTARAALLPPARTRPVNLHAGAPGGLTPLPPALSGLFGAPAQTSPIAPAPLWPETHEQSASVFEPAAGISAGAVDIELAEEVTLDMPAPELGEGDDDATFEVIMEESDPGLAGDFALPADQQDPVAPVAAEPAREPAVAWYGDDATDPWEPEDEPEVAEIVADIGDEDEAADAELVFDADTEPVGLHLESDAGAPEEAEARVREAAPPVSPWDLGAGARTGEAAERTARARAEWESLGQALSDSLAASSPPPEVPGPHGYELTDEKAAELDSGSDTPFGGAFLSVSSHGSKGAESPVSELARRLEAFASTLRAEGPSALSRAQTGDDRFDALLASIAAGFLAGRGE